MHYKSKRKCAVGLLIGLALFAGCAARPGAAPILADEKGDGPESRAETLEMLVQGTDIIHGAGSETGFYYVDMAPENMLTGNIRYVDYASGQDVFLSSQVNSDHKGQEDPSYLDSTMGETALFLQNGQLFFLRGGAPAYAANESFGERALSAIYSMGLDGAGRKRIYQGDSTSTLLPVVLTDNEFLYCFRLTTKETELFRLAFDGRKEEPIAAFPFGTQFLGGWDRELIVQTIEDIQSNNDHRTNYTVYAFNVDTGEQTPIVSWESEKLVYTAVNQDAFYLMGVKDSLLERYTIAGAKETYPLASYVSDTSFVCDLITSIGKYLFVPYYDEQNGEYYNLIIDTSDFSAVKNTIAYYDESKNAQYQAKVIGETEKEFLVITKSYMGNATLDLEDGTGTSIDLPVYQMELFEKSDYLASKNVSRQVVRQN